MSVEVSEGDKAALAEMVAADAAFLAEQGALGPAPHSLLPTARHERRLFTAAGCEQARSTIRCSSASTASMAAAAGWRRCSSRAALRRRTASASTFSA